MDTTGSQLTLQLELVAPPEGLAGRGYSVRDRSE